MVKDPGFDSALRRPRMAKFKIGPRGCEMEICHCADSEIGKGFLPMQSHGVILSEWGCTIVTLVASRATSGTGHLTERSVGYESITMMIGLEDRSSKRPPSLGCRQKVTSTLFRCLSPSVFSFPIKFLDYRTEETW